MHNNKAKITTVLFLLPVCLAFTLIIVIPFLRGIYLSFTDWDRAGQSVLNVVGLINYETVFKDPQFMYSLIWTFTYTILNVIIVNAIAIGLSMAVTRNLKFKNIYRAGFFLPNLIGGIVLGTVWLFIFNNVLPIIGDYFAQLLGAKSALALFLQTPFLNNPETAKAALVIVGSWQYIGYIMMIYIAAIQNIPQDLVEASNIDGANAFQRFRNVTLPLIAQAFTIGTFLTLVNSFKQYDINLMLGAGAPTQLINNEQIQSTQLLALDIVKRGQLGSIDNMRAVAQAEAITFFIILFIISIVQLKLTKNREVEM